MPMPATVAEGANCVPGNFVRTLRATPQALALGLVLTGDEKKPDYAKLVQDSNRFLLNHMAQEAATATGTGTGTGISLALAPLFTTKTSAVSRCHACGHEARRALDTLFIDLVYPPDEQLRAAPPTFAGLLQGSVERETEARAWCEACQAYKPSVSRRVAEALPDILAVGCQARTPTELGLWHAEDGTDNAFLPPALSVALDGDRLAIAPAAGEARDDDPDRYELVAVIVYVSDDVAGGNVVAEIKGAHGMPCPPRPAPPRPRALCVLTHGWAHLVLRQDGTSSTTLRSRG
jgi:PAB-dependent poly(A)-specific ribonuclease subunit 2